LGAISAASHVSELEAMAVAANSLDLELHRFEVRRPDEFASAFEL
jgi:hypothetical protein